MSIRENNGFISQKDLIWFRAMAKTYESLNDTQVQQLLDLREFVDIHHDQKI
ncbi:hypothetical protein [Pseudomonas sp. B19125]|uniref:hypothetical protein n=1 Tax=Pseudomonas sp. B19125 TaxID=3235109 RepID=UPI0037842861